MTIKSDEGTSQEEVTVDTTTQTPENNQPDQEQTLGEVITPTDDSDVEITPAKGKDNEEMVPLHVVLDMKSEIKDLKKQLADKSITTGDYDQEIQALQEKYDVDADFLKDIFAVSDKRAEAKFAPQIQQISAKDKAKKQLEVIDTLYEQSIKANPEFADVANKAIIIELAKNPANHGKTMTQLLDEAYGRVVQKGTRTLESTQPGASKASEHTVDFDNMDTETEARVLKDPELAKELATHNMKYIKNLL